MKTRTIRLTAEGLAQKEQELLNLQQRRPDAVCELARARELGDLSENAAYKVARSALTSLDRRIRQLQGVLRRAVAVEKRSDGRVGIGNRVTIQGADTELIITLVEGYESDFAQGKLSCHSPIGRVLMGRQAGDTVYAKIPQGTAKYTITAVS